jgi:hypothetical protein
MTEEELREIEERARNATKGPWEWHRRDSSGRLEGLPQELRRGFTVVLEPVYKEVYGDPWIDGWSGDLDFVAHSREDVPKLVAEVRRLGKQRCETCGFRAPAKDETLRGSFIHCRAREEDWPNEGHCHVYWPFPGEEVGDE